MALIHTFPPHAFSSFSITILRAFSRAPSQQVVIHWCRFHLCEREFYSEGEKGNYGVHPTVYLPNDLWAK